MATRRQTAANRRNAQHSTGPRTPEGRRVSSLNALKHGLRSQLTVIPGEDPAEYQALFDEFCEDARPCSARDLVAIRQAAQSEWRLRRIAAVESAIYRKAVEAAAQPQIPHLTPANIDSILDQLPLPNSRPPEPPADLIASRLLTGDVNRLAALGRYESGLIRQYREAWADLDSRPDFDSRPDPEPVTASEPDLQSAPQPDPEPPYTQPSPYALAWQSASQVYQSASRLHPESATSPGDFEPSSPLDEPLPTPAPASVNSITSEDLPARCQSNPIPQPDSTPARCNPPQPGPFPASFSPYDIAEWVERCARSKGIDLDAPADDPLDEDAALDPAA